MNNELSTKKALNDHLSKLLLKAIEVEYDTFENVRYRIKDASQVLRSIHNGYVTFGLFERVCSELDLNANIVITKNGEFVVDSNL